MARGFFEEEYDSASIIQYMNESFDVLNEANVVRMDKATMKRKMFTRATLAAAKSANDPLYSKYVLHTKKRKMYRRAIHDKYQGKAKAIMQQWIKENND